MGKFSFLTFIFFTELHYKMVKRKSTDFFDVILPLPHDLTRICLEYCCYRYCETCNDVFPSNFKCLSCPSLTGVKYHTKGFTRYYTNYFTETIKFDTFIDQVVWDYVQLKIPGARSKSSRSWIGSEKIPHVLKLSVDRKRTRSNNEWWSEKFYPHKCFNQKLSTCKPMAYKQTHWHSFLDDNRSSWTKTME